MAEVSPTFRQRELASRLRALREDSGLTPVDVAEKLLFSTTKLSRLETGQRRASLRDVRDLCQLYRVGEQETAHLMELASQARESGWWTQFTDLKLVPYIGLEQGATAITTYAMYYVPALMQSEAYARAIIRGIGRKIAPEILEERVAARLKRQEILDREPPPRYRAILDEAVLHREIGGPAVMSAQLGKILNLISAEKVTVQVIPFNAGAHASADSNFDFLEFGDTLPGLVYVESLVNQAYQEKPDELKRYREATEYLRDAALSPRETIARIEEVQKVHQGAAKK